MSEFLRLHELHAARWTSPSLTNSPRVCSNSCPLSQGCYPTISSSVAPSPPALNLSQHRGLFQCVGSSHQVAKVLELQHQSFQRILGLISFRIGWFHLLAVQETLKSLLQHHSQKASVLGCSAFITVQLSHLDMTTGKTIALTLRAFVDKVMSLLCAVLCLVTQRVQLFANLWTVPHQALLSQEVLQARTLEWVAMPSSRGPSQPRGLNPGLPHFRQILYQLSHQGSPRILEWVAYPFPRRTSQTRN